MSTHNTRLATYLDNWY